MALQPGAAFYAFYHEIERRNHLEGEWHATTGTAGLRVDTHRRHARVREVHARLQERRLQRRRLAPATRVTPSRSTSIPTSWASSRPSLERLTANLSIFRTTTRMRSTPRRSAIRCPTSTSRASSIWRTPLQWAWSWRRSGRCTDALQMIPELQLSRHQDRRQSLLHRRR